VSKPTGRLARLLADGAFTVTGEIVPPRGANAAVVMEHARGLVGSVDAVNLTDNPTSTAHMSPLAGVRFAYEAGLEPTVQITARDRNRLGLTADLLGAWALGARNVFCLSGDPIAIGDHPDAAVVADLSVTELVGLARRMRDEGTTLAGAELDEPPRYLIGVADVPFADPYDPQRLESKLDAGADFVVTQIVYDAERLAAWADTMRARGLFERTKVIIGATPLQSAKQARFMDERLPGVSVPASMVAALEAAGEEAPEIGLELAVELIAAVRSIDGVAGIHVMAMGHDEVTRELVDRAGLFPRPVVRQR
jgi:methylenetetrahydrofolate reductase (NADPH)